MSHRLDHLMTVAVHEEVERLRTLSLSDLMALPSVTECKKLVVDGREIGLMVWHDLLPDGEHRIVVQANRHGGWPGLVTYLTAEGFAATASGTLRDLTDDELSPFW